MLISAVAHRGGLQLQSCKLTRTSPQIAPLLKQLPSHCLTSLELNVLTPDDSTAPFSPCEAIAGLSNCLQHLTSLRKLSLAADLETISNRRPALDPLLQQLSVLTRLTDLALGDSTSTVLVIDNLRHLPASLKVGSRCSDCNGFGSMQSSRSERRCIATRRRGRGAHTRPCCTRVQLVHTVVDQQQMPAAHQLLFMYCDC